MGRLFGTDGVRGVANTELTPEMAFRLGRAGAHVLKAQADSGGRILVGRDTRLSGPLLEAALAAGVASTGTDVLLTGVVSTPALAYLVRQTRSLGGAMISASHNPAEYNGIKFFTPDGYKLPDEVEDRIESLVQRDERDMPRPEGRGVGLIEGGAFGSPALRPGAPRAADLEGMYVDYVCGTASARLDGMRVVLDCANGAAYRLAPLVFSRLGAEVTVINDRPDGLNINEGCGSLHVEGLREAVLRRGADAGLAFDGDADRVIGIDEKGNVVDGDRIMFTAARFLARKGKLAGNTLVATVMSNLGLEKALAGIGIRLLRAKVGDRYVLEAMRQGGYVLGGEQSGHVIFLEHTTTGDGILTGVQLLSIIRAEGVPLSEPTASVPNYPQVLVNVRTPNPHSVDKNGRVREVIAEVEGVLAGSGRILVRPSGTEPLVRVMVEGEDQVHVEALADKVASVIGQEMGLA